MRPITGTHVYSYVKCPRLAALDLHLPRSERRPPTEWEEFAAQRGRDFEAQFVAGLGAVAPVYPEREFAAGAAATRELLRAGTPWVHQGVLQTEDCLGLPDLLRRLPGASALGDHHYEVLDVKTSGRPRGEQILQVVFYSHLLAELQGRVPSRGALVLKDGREERFAIADYAAALAEVLAALRELRADAQRARPFLQAHCSGCYHDRRCLAELATAGDLSLLQGMSHGARAILESKGCRTVAELAAFHPGDSRARGHLDAALVRRLRRAAEAHLLGRPLLETRPRGERFAEAVLLHLLTDPYTDRVLAFGALQPAVETGRFSSVCPTEAAGEWRAFQELMATLPAKVQLLHFGEALPRWYEQQVFQREAEPALEARLVDLQPRLRSAATYPRAVFGLPDLVRYGLGRDPLRAGHAGAAALWAAAGETHRLRDKLHADLCDLAALRMAILEAEPVVVPAGERAPAGSAAAEAGAARASEG